MVAGGHRLRVEPAACLDERYEAVERDPFVRAGIVDDRLRASDLLGSRETRAPSAGTRQGIECAHEHGGGLRIGLTGIPVHAVGLAEQTESALQVLLLLSRGDPLEIVEVALGTRPLEKRVRRELSVAGQELGGKLSQPFRRDVALGPAESATQGVGALDAQRPRRHGPADRLIPGRLDRHPADLGHADVEKFAGRLGVTDGGTEGDELAGLPRGDLGDLLQ